MLSRTDQRYQNIVTRVEDLARTQSGEPLHIQFLCKQCGVTERTLRNAFHAVYGKTPYRHLRDLRMLDARHALLQPQSPATTVTAIAMQFGFLELGRFSVEYRSTFGERPSETLRRAASADCASFRPGLKGADVVQSAA
jgi:transcriptional regulator GlxA family with amidase domain